MKLHPTVFVTIAVIVLSACETTLRSPGPAAVPVAKSAPIAKPAPVIADNEFDPAEAVRGNDDTGDNAGLGTIVYNGVPLIQCGRQVRLGSRIRREVCVPDGFNGMYPSGGINMGTAKESQRRYD